MFKNSEDKLKAYISKSTPSKRKHAPSTQSKRQTNTTNRPTAAAASNTGDKRKISYDILKNKGLTAHRKKENRNARVKKRNKYAKAQMKLKSQRGVFEGQQGPYVGEATGIRRNVSRSTKLS